MRPQRAIIVAVSPEQVIGLHGKIPWHYAGDLKRFKRETMGAVIVMGRKTFESMGSRPLPGRRNIVITRKNLSDIEHYPHLDDALTQIKDLPTWFIGGARIYEEAMPHCDALDVTHVPISIKHPDAGYFPKIPANLWTPGPIKPHPDEPDLHHQIFTRRND